jgi:hypothetical protein
VRIVAIVVALLTLAAVGASAPAARPGAASPPLLAAVWFGEDAQLARLDPSTLDPAGPRLSLGHFGAWVLSPAGDRLAVGRVSPAGVRLVDTGRMARLGMVKLAPSGTVTRIAWLRPNRLVAVYAHYDGSWIAWVDTQARRVLKRSLLGADPPVTATAGGRFVALIQPSTKIGAAKLAVATADGRLRVVRLPSIRIGTALPAKQGKPVRRVLPGLAVDPSGARAYVVGTEGVVAAVDLRSLRVATHRLRQAGSLARVPAAATKSISGPILQAQWVGDGRLAVVGTTYRATSDTAGEHQFSSPLGLRLVDVRTWTQRTLDASATDVAVAGGALLAYGVLVDWSSKTTTYSGMGIATYGTDGSARSRLLPGQPVGWVQVAGGTAYGWLVEEENIRHVLVIDLASGTVERDLKLARPTQLLLGDGGSY